MDRKVIVLTPTEWENRSTLLEFAKQSHNHNHYNKDAQLTIKSIVHLAKDSLNEGRISDAIECLDKIPTICDRIYEDSRKAQEGISDLMTLIQEVNKQGY